MKHLRWGLLAAGNIAGKFAKGLATTDEATALALGSRSLDKAKDFARKHGIERAYGSYQDLLADPDVDAVYISTPNSLHAEWSMKAAKAGKHVLCEKPATMNAAELEKVLEVIRECDVFFMEAFMYRCHPQWKKLLDILDAGTIGEVRVIESSFSFNMGLKLDNIRLSNPLAGGALMDVGCYCVSFCRLAAGEEPVECRAVARIGGESRVDEQTTGVLRFPSGAVAHFDCATQCGVPRAAKVYGSEGSVVVTDPWQPQGGKSSLVVTAGGKTETIDVTDDRQAPAMNWEDSLGQMRALDAIRKDMGLRFDCE